MATISEITRGLQAVKTVSQARVVLKEARSELLAAFETGHFATDLRRSLIDVDGLTESLSPFPGSALVPAWFDRQKVLRAFVNVAGATGQARARATVSLANEIKQSASELPSTVFRPLGDALGSAARGVGEIGGGLVGGILKGLGPVVLLVLALVLWAKFFRKA
jgi:hypothetical protein